MPNGARRPGIGIALALRSDQRPDVIGQAAAYPSRFDLALRLDFAEMLDEERFDQPHVLGGGESRPAVTVPLDDLQRDLDAGLLQPRPTARSAAAARCRPCRRA